MKTIVLTGAGGGIGQSIIPVLHEMGYKLLLTTRSTTQELEAFVERKQIPAKVFQADLTLQSEVEDLFNWALEQGGFDVLVNNAGIAHAAASWKLDAVELHALMDTNFYSAVRCTQQALQTMRQQDFGRVISISSVVAHQPSFGTSGYAATKSALEGYMRGVAHDTASKNITANTLAYGYMDAGMLHEVPKAMLDDIQTRIPKNAFGSPHQIAAYIQLLIESPFTTGQTLHVNGGQWMP